MKTLEIEHLTIEELSERERDAYYAGDIERANLYAEVHALRAQLEALEDVETLESWEKRNGRAEDYKEFFDACFHCLAAHYPAPSVSSEYDQSVIFDAIRRGENLTD